MTLGAGFSAAGLSPAGFGDIVTAAAPATDNLIDEFGVQQNARAIDPSTGQYILRSTGRAQGMPRVRQLVLLRVRTVLGSSAVSSLGFAAPGGDRDEHTGKRIEAAFAAALSDLVKANLIAIVSVTFSADTNTRERGQLIWRDLTTNTEYREPV